MRKYILFYGLILCSILNSNAQYGQFESAYIYQFTNFIEWPSSKKSGDFVIGVVGNADVNQYLQVLAKSRKVGSRAIVVKQFKLVEEANGCHIIFLANNKLSDFMTACEKAKASQALLITEKEGYGKKGAGINFVIKGGKLKFELNKSSLKFSGLSVSSKLEQLAIIVG